MPGYMSGRKVAKSTPSLSNKATCGGPKKGGLSPTFGMSASNAHATRRGGVTTQPHPWRLGMNAPADCPASYRNYRGFVSTGGIGKRVLLVRGSAAAHQ